MKVFNKFFKQNSIPTPENCPHKKAIPIPRFLKKLRLKKRKTNRNTPRDTVARFTWFCVGILVIFLIGFSFFLPIFKSATALDYFDYVSELRSNILTAQTQEYSLKVYAVEKEYPYFADGIKRETTARTEIYFTAPSGDKTCKISFTVNGKTHEGEMSYDNVKSEYSLSDSVDCSNLESVDFNIHYGEENFHMTAKTIKTDKTLSPRQALDKLRENAPSVFQNLTDGNAFVGEIYLRLISEDAPYYYIGIIEKNGNIQAFLLNSESGKILAKREQGIIP